MEINYDVFVLKSCDLLTFLAWNWTCNSLLHFLHYEIGSSTII